MNHFMKLREQGRNFIAKYEAWLNRALKGVMTLIALSVIVSSFGYSEVLSYPWIRIAVSVLCAFVPLSAMSIVVEVFLLFELLSLSRMVALVALIFFVVSYVLCGVYHGRG